MTGKSLFLAGIVAACGACAVQAQLVTEWNWDSTKTGNQDWQVAANWPNQLGFPNDPGRVDPDDTVITPVVGANLSVALAGNLTVNVGATDVTVASLRLGGTAGAVTTTVVGSGGRLIFENFENNDNPPPPMGQPPKVLQYSFNESRALIISGGVAGSTNVISVPIFLNHETLDIDSNRDANAPVGFVSTNDLLINGPITFTGGSQTSNSIPGIDNYLPAGLKLTVSSPLAIPNNNLNPMGGETEFDFHINGSISNGGLAEYSGVISGAGDLLIGNVSNSEVLPLSTVILSGANTITGRIAPNRANIVLANDLAFGTGPIKSKTITGEFGNNLLSDNDSRNLANRMIFAQFVTVKGEHSLEWSGPVEQDNARGWINLLPAGKEFKLSGTQYIDGDSEPDLGGLPAADKQYIFDGSGLTRVTGAIRNHETASVSRSIFKYGTGPVYLQGSLTGNNSDYSFRTVVSGGNLHVATINDLGSSTIVSRAGGIGLENGTVTGPDSSAFLSRVNNKATAPTSAIVTQQGNIGNDFASFDAWDHGGLMLAAGEYAGNLDFTTGDLANAQDMSLAARDRSTTTQYTGTITPGNATYRLGGGGGILQLPNTNQLTGARSLVVQNGLDFGPIQQIGMVRLTNTNNYTGTTSILGEQLNSNEANGIADNNVENSSQFRGTTLSVSSLANGGVASSIGSSSSAAANLYVQGGTLRYEGAATSTDRLLTIGTRGGTIEASGSGAVTFSNTGAIAMGIAAVRNGDVVGQTWIGGIGLIADIQSGTADLVPGMTVAASGVVEGSSPPDGSITIAEIVSPTRIRLSDPISAFTSFNNTPVTFGTAPRTLTLSGTNSSNNTFAPLIGDDATTGNVSLVKSGAGKWVLTNPGNNWAGNTTVSAGTLSITNPTLNDTADVLLLPTSTFDLDFAGIDTIGGLFFNGVQQVGGTWGSLLSSAANKRSWFTGLGVLNVTETVMLGKIGGDFNGDGYVDAADYTTWRDNLGAATDDALNGNGDGNPGVTSADYDLWKTNFGMTAPPLAIAALGAAASVPEPATLVLLLLAGVPLAVFRRRV
ncbi:Autotransporter-associated beta strand repeat protein [Pirellulimonas nuda]|uniref:Autotransporter-associated beta strand repeat protein n=1 Tax=Pirellulimonas nuda TaxID=2528009 RepID=A0A518DG06_9BACT|nr:autotransporter-associated beta strand repeat-containing protein [Pirellulimonas nuda]QDU90404.1 Autotransporter-associated beta strand repeat protein [Pirellulimonas nuda]